MNDVEKIDDCMIDVFCNAYAENKGNPQLDRAD